MKNLKRIVLAAAPFAAALSVSTSALAVDATTVVTAVQHYTAGNSFVLLEGLSDQETGANDNGVVNVNTTTSYRCDRAGATLDVPFIDNAQSNAEQAMDIALSAQLSGRPVFISWGADCKITMIKIQ